MSGVHPADQGWHSAVGGAPAGHGTEDAAANAHLRGLLPPDDETELSVRKNRQHLAAFLICSFRH